VPIIKSAGVLHFVSELKRRDPTSRSSRPWRVSRRARTVRGPLNHLAPPRASHAASGSSANPGFTARFLEVGGGARAPEIAAEEGPNFNAGGVLAALHPLDCRSRRVLMRHGSGWRPWPSVRNSWRASHENSITCISFPSRATVKHAVSRLHYCACSGGGPSLATAGGFHFPVKASIRGA
jgi:hypothetical protein